MDIAIIPARGGSKRIPGKNIKLFHGKPIIAYAIESALQSRCFDAVIVSTDDAEIAELSRQFGAQTPFTRPDSLSNDFVGVRDVFLHAVKNTSEHYRADIDLAVCLLPTSPLYSASMLGEHAQWVRSMGGLQAFLATEFSYPIQRGFTLNDTAQPKMLFPEHLSSRSQDLEKIYHDAGVAYFLKKASSFESIPPFLSDSASAIKLPHYLVQDIDTHDDWLRAEAMYEAYKRLKYL